VTITWDGVSQYLRKGLVLGLQNLSAVIPPSDPKRSPDGGAVTLSKAALSNWVAFVAKHNSIPCRRTFV
jgi:hypothetical protein